jgi:hypothetical protein
VEWSDCTKANTLEVFPKYAALEFHVYDAQSLQRRRGE